MFRFWWTPSPLESRMRPTSRGRIACCGCAPNREQTRIDRSSPFTYPPDTPLRSCSAEDLIVLKAFADRPKDWMDIDGVLVRQSPRLDGAYAFRPLAPLAELKDAPEIVAWLERMRTQITE